LLRRSRGRVPQRPLPAPPGPLRCAAFVGGPRRCGQHHRGSPRVGSLLDPL